jgi:hypothetical protein
MYFPVKKCDRRAGRIIAWRKIVRLASIKRQFHSATRPAGAQQKSNLRHPHRLRRGRPGSPMAGAPVALVELPKQHAGCGTCAAPGTEPVPMLLTIGRCGYDAHFAIERAADPRLRQMLAPHARTSDRRHQDGLPVFTKYARCRAQSLMEHPLLRSRARLATTRTRASLTSSTTGVPRVPTRHGRRSDRPYSH